MRFVLGIAALVCAVAGAFFFFKPASVLHRTTILVGTSPVSVWSWNKTDDTFDVIVLPSDVAADSIAYGRYRLDALWKLGFIDKKGGLALARSLTDVLALPIERFIGEGEKLAATDDIEAYTRRLFSWSSVWPTLLGKRVTNIFFSDWVAFAWALKGAGSEDIHLIDLVHEPPTGSEVLPDQSTREFLDIQRLDVILKGRFEDEQVRQEAITVGVYNTTSTPALGTYAARILAQEGVLVVAVGNSDMQIDACIVEASEELVKSRTVRVIAEVFDCKTAVTQEQERADVNVKLGSEFAKRFATGN